MLEYDTACRAALGFELDTYGTDLREYIFNEDYLEPREEKRKEKTYVSGHRNTKHIVTE
jgi:hypothetical protein